MRGFLNLANGETVEILAGVRAGDVYEYVGKDPLTDPEETDDPADEPNWLGQPSGSMAVLPKSTPDILGGSAAPFSSELVNLRGLLTS